MAASLEFFFSWAGRVQSYIVSVRCELESYYSCALQANKLASFDQQVLYDLVAFVTSGCFGTQIAKELSPLPGKAMRGDQILAGVLSIRTTPSELRQCQLLGKIIILLRKKDTPQRSSSKYHPHG